MNPSETPQTENHYGDESASAPELPMSSGLNAYKNPAEQDLHIGHEMGHGILDIPDRGNQLDRWYLDSGYLDQLDRWYLDSGYLDQLDRWYLDRWYLDRRYRDQLDDLRPHFLERLRRTPGQPETQSWVYQFQPHPEGGGVDWWILGNSGLELSHWQGVFILHLGSSCHGVLERLVGKTPLQFFLENGIPFEGTSAAQYLKE